MVEIFFGIITRQALRRGTFVSVADIEAAITTYIDAYNDRAKPFAWTRTADQLIGKIKRKSSITRDTSGGARLLGDGPRRRHGAPRLGQRIRSPAAVPNGVEQVVERRVIERR